MKKIIALALLVILAMGVLAGCTQEPERGTLKVALSPDFAPMEFVDPTQSGQDQYVGFDVTLAKYIAQQLDMDLELIPMSFDACQTAVYSGTADISISGYTWTQEREDHYNLSDHYRASTNEDRQVLITLAENAGKYTTAESLAGAKIGAQNASLQESLISEQLPDAELISFSDIGAAVAQLKNGNFDCIAVADGNADAIISSNPEVIKSGFHFEVDEKYTGNVILIQKGNDELTEKINQILAQAEPYFDEWYEEARSVAGIDVSYDEQGNVVTAPTE